MSSARFDLAAAGSGSIGAPSRATSTVSNAPGETQWTAPAASGRQSSAREDAPRAEDPRVLVGTARPRFAAAGDAAPKRWTPSTARTQKHASEACVGLGFGRRPGGQARGSNEARGGRPRRDGRIATGRG
jgi:hypothetical protein